MTRPPRRVPATSRVQLDALTSFQLQADGDTVAAFIRRVATLQRTRGCAESTAQRQALREWAGPPEERPW